MAKKGDLDKPVTKGDLLEFKGDIFHEIGRTRSDLIEIIGKTRGESQKDVRAVRDDLTSVIWKLDAKREKQLIESRDEFREFKEDLFTSLDSHTAILKRLDQERMFTLERIKRIETDIDLIKKHVGLVA
ncbi:hypothetical protein HYZ64_00490 [Candidatus Berkelbacteria bacterium]|nr:hypothetical protein [Candidatus Berkelbacteria bacterium]